MKRKIVSIILSIMVCLSSAYAKKPAKLQPISRELGTVLKKLQPMVNRLDNFPVKKLTDQQVQKLKDITPALQKLHNNLAGLNKAQLEKLQPKLAKLFPTIAKLKPHTKEHEAIWKKLQFGFHNFQRGDTVKEKIQEMVQVQALGMEENLVGIYCNKTRGRAIRGIRRGSREAQIPRFEGQRNVTNPDDLYARGRGYRCVYFDLQSAGDFTVNKNTDGTYTLCVPKKYNESLEQFVYENGNKVARETQGDMDCYTFEGVQR